jgi:hypothetical protein
MLTRCFTWPEAISGGSGDSVPGRIRTCNLWESRNVPNFRVICDFQAFDLVRC